MTHSFDKAYWQQRWHQAHGGRPGSMAGNPPHPYLAREIGALAPGTALDAGCGAGAEALWLASHGWQVTAADISADALARAADRAAASRLSQPVRWVEADLTVWEPGLRFDLVTTHYAHPAMPQLAFYQRVSTWVAPRGTLLIVGHLHTPGSTGHGHGHHHPAEATVTLADITGGLGPAEWEIVTAEEHQRPVPGPAGQTVTLHDVVVRATRRR
ncbi:methyltransferase domain-containing protein [Dactylosporangium aurantiacum]|uniref:Methyltransferase domain-containing protein n=1 Tax=Dactylosporangium aurantiacum TaxID=35754 RepID=A0A9Q9MDK1_9ACTN|nr:methyltransferase domain-containing protein [Dactylosporangium aurantiacum]MDG6109278.1 methyltransferase domain-containing protein [Dactylosporangium aurantiacum]UWZ50365.1 methyltransferase domain-containing protein [Dactylosporangium aurantiacum]